MPLFIMILVGWLMRRVGLIDDTLNSGINKLVVKVFLPLMLFYSTYTGDLRSGLNVKFVIFAVAAMFFMHTVMMLIVPKLVQDERKRSVMVMSVYRANTAIYGIPVIAGIYGDDATGNVMLMLSFAILAGNFLAVFAIETFSGKKTSAGKTLVNCLKTPIIIGLMLGVLLQFLPFRLPELILSPIKSIGNVTTPLAFISLGANFTLAASYKNRKYIFWSVLGKLVISPLIWVSIGLALGFRRYELCAIICAFSTPTAVSSYAMVAGYGDDSELMGEIIVFSTAFSLITLFIQVFTFMSLGLF